MCGDLLRVTEFFRDVKQTAWKISEPTGFDLVLNVEKQELRYKEDRMSLSYSGAWHREGNRFEERILVKDPVYYRHVYTEDGILSGVIVDYELADDFHYELTGDAWKQFSARYFHGDDELQAFRAFLASNQEWSAFEKALDAAGIEFKKETF